MKLLARLAVAACLFPAAAMAQSAGAPTGTGTAVTPNGRSPLANMAFVNQAATGGMAEVMAGQMAQQKATSAGVRDFGAMMVADHTTVNQQLMALAMKKGVTPPAQLDPDHMAEAQQLGNVSGAAFDRQYVTGQITDHKNQILLFQQEATSGVDPEMKALAQMTLPILQRHLEMAQMLAAKM